MTAVILSFACGVVWMQVQSELPGMGWFGLSAFLLVPLLRQKVLYLPAAFAVGFCWALGLAHMRLADRLTPELEGRDIEVVGVIASLPAVGERSLRFEFEPESAVVKLPGKILLSWYRSPFFEEQPSILAAPVHPGEPWRFTVRLRRPPGHFNPPGFAYQAWLLAR